MSTSECQPRDGDEVEVVLRGTVTGVGIDGFRIGDETVLIDEHVVSVTRVRPPLPTEPGNVIELLTGDSAGAWLGLNGLGEWSQLGQDIFWDEEDIAEQDWEPVSVPAPPAGDLTDGRVVPGASPSRDDDLDARITAAQAALAGRPVAYRIRGSFTPLSSGGAVVECEWLASDPVVAVPVKAGEAL